MDIVERLRHHKSSDVWTERKDRTWYETDDLCMEAADEIDKLREDRERLQQWVNELELLAIGLDDASIKCCKLEDEIKWLRWALRKIRGALGDPISNLLPHEIAQDALDGKW